MEPKNKWYRHSARVPVDREKLLKHHKGEGINLKPGSSKIKHKIQRQKLGRREKIIEQSIEDAARAEVLLTEDHGFLVGEEGETTTQFKQCEIVKNVDITSATKHFKLDLEFGPYKMRYTRNGRHLLLGGKRGHVAAFDWVTKKLACEMNVMETVHDVVWFHVETMYAVAQKDWVYVYDHQGIELHCLKQMNKINGLEFLPYHFLLVGGARTGFMTWLDISLGQIVSSFNTKLDNISIMTQNPSNAIICVGNSKGVISMWSPNSRQPLAKMLCHRNGISACAVHPYGTYMATSSYDRTLKIWDIRQLSGPLHNFKLGSPCQNLSYSQRGLLSISMGNVVEIYRDTQNTMKSYMRHISSWNVNNTQFCPYEDVLGIGTAKGYTSILVPGSGEANFDGLEVNPFQTKEQRREAEVKALLDKIQPDLITLDPGDIAEVDIPTLKRTAAAKKNLLYIKPKPLDFKPRKTKAKGRGGTAKVIKTKNILKDMKRKELIDIKGDIESELLGKKKKPDIVPRKNYGTALNRFLPKL